MENKSVWGLDENIAAALSYLFGPVSGLFVLVMERRNKFVRFHALQSTLWFLILCVIRWGVGFFQHLLGWIPVVNLIVNPTADAATTVISLVGVISTVYLMVRAFGNATVKIPIIGDIAWRQVNK